jgi:predicted homoserine dehydrogenase-like protein
MPDGPGGSGAVPAEQLLEHGIVDYVVSAEPAPGVFVIGHQEHPTQRVFLDLYKLGEGLFYTFYRPYHLCHFEVPATIARAVHFGDATVAPLGAPLVEVVTAAKRALRAGEVLDGIGRYMSYGLAENADIVGREPPCRWASPKALGCCATWSGTRCSPR